MFGTVNEVENSGKVSWNRSESGIQDALQHANQREMMPDEERAVVRALDAERHQIQYDEARDIIQPRPETAGSARAKTIDDFRELSIEVHR